MKSASCILLLLAGLPLAGFAQSRTAADSLRRQRGELVGARPAGILLGKPRGQAANRHGSAADPVQIHLLGTEVDVAQATAGQLPDLYEQFITVTREERRKWSYQNWAGAGEVLARLNQRYEQVRTELPLEERLRIRTYQGEFHTLRGARDVKQKLD